MIGGLDRIEYDTYILVYCFQYNMISLDIISNK